tara:strand:+ start:1356 stop:2267 length:912 start_codon:yes stop_codon:yes gene_type:complete
MEELVNIDISARPRRSVLYMPGSNARALEKAQSLPADGLILDLEDAVSPDAKLTARDQVCAAVKARSYGDREVAIRVNGLDTEWGRDDIAAAAVAGPDAILLPKVENGEMVADFESLLTINNAPTTTGLWFMIETPLGVLKAADIASASDRARCFVMGTNDLTKDIQATHTAQREPMLTSLGLCILAARSYGLAILDGVHNDLQDDEGFFNSCMQGRELGMDGKTLIHPKQIKPCNDAFAPSEEEIANAHQVVEAFSQAKSAGKGVVVVNGRLVENLHVENAQRLIHMKEAIKTLEEATSNIT